MEHSILQTVLWSYLICINIITIAVYGIDKRSAVRGKWRIRVSTLLGLAAAGGSVGALLGMHLFHHKTRKKKFTIGVPLMLAAQILLLFFPTLSFTVPRLFSPILLFFFLAKAGLLFFA